MKERIEGRKKSLSKNLGETRNRLKGENECV
jgi:hypothetical protein